MRKMAKGNMKQRKFFNLVISVVIDRENTEIVMQIQCEELEE